MKIEEERKGGLAVFLLVSILAFCIGASVWQEKKKARLLREGRFTVGTVVKVKPTAKTRKLLYYRVNIMGKTYNCNTLVYEYDKNIIGQRFYVVFSPEKPTEMLILLDKKVPEKIGDPPPEGWAKIPKVLWNNWPVVVGKRPSKSGHAKQDTSSSGRDVR